jgi:hypothetical protein
MNKLTKREKLLIYILGCFLIGLFGFYFVVGPSYRQFITVNDQAGEAEFTQKNMEMVIDGIPASMQARDDTNLKLASLKSPFSQALPNEGVDRLLTQLCLSHGLAPQVLAIQSNEAKAVSIFKEYTGKNKSAAMIGSGENNGSSSGTQTETTTSGSATGTSDSSGSGTEPGFASSIQTTTSVVDMELTGNQNNFYQLLDDVANRPDMIVSAFEIAPIVSADAITSTSGTSTTNVVYTGYVPKLDGGNIKIKVTFNVFMVEK